MPELIDRQSALSVCKEYGWIDDEDFIEGYNTAIKDIREAIKELPAIEAEPVRHGRFVFEKGDGKTCLDGWICTACKFGYHTNVPYFADFKYCPACGSRMDGGADNG